MKKVKTGADRVNRAGLLVWTWLLLAVPLAPQLSAEEVSPKRDPRYPFRTDFANEHLPWYQPQPLEFPPHHSDRRIGGELVSVDFILRKGQFRAMQTGELMDFTLPPYGVMRYLNAEADLREIPLGTFFLFFLNLDAFGNFTRLATAQDQFSMDLSHSFSYRLDEVRLDEGKLLVTKRSIPKKQADLGSKELAVTRQTRIWKGDRQIALEDLVPGDELLYNLTGKTTASPGRCTNIWVGSDTHQLVSKRQQGKFIEFTKARGLPGWIEKTEGNGLTITFFSGNARGFNAAWMNDLVVGNDLRVCVANDELRTWNPPVDGERGKILEVRQVPTKGYGCSGVRIVTSVPYMLEGFRRGRVVRVFGSGWPVENPPYGESLMNYGYAALRNQVLRENVAKEYPEQFPYRTDYGNAHLPWYRLQPGVTPPRFSAHVVFGELVKADPERRAGRFHIERTGEVVDFTMTETGADFQVGTDNPENLSSGRNQDASKAVRYLNADASLADLPLGQRYRFQLYQDERGQFTRCTFISDEYSHLAVNLVTLRIEALDLDMGRIVVAHQLPRVTNHVQDVHRPPDIGRSELQLSAESRVWSEKQPLRIADLKPGDTVLVNITSEQPGRRTYCADIWLVKVKE